MLLECIDTDIFANSAEELQVKDIVVAQGCGGLVGHAKMTIALNAFPKKAVLYVLTNTTFT